MALEVVTMIAIDTNLLVYAHRRAIPEHRASKAAIEKAADDPGGWGIPLPCIAEFFCIATHPSNTKPSTSERAAAFIRSLVQSGGAQVWRPGHGFLERLMQLATETKTAGVRIYDLQIALVALENGAHELWSHDREFRRIPGLSLRDPIG